MVVLYGGVTAALICWLIAHGCRIPRMIDAP
jgi:hypothetical protein